MFVVNQDGDLCEILKRVSYEIDWDNKTKKELKDIYSRMYKKAYNYGSTDNCLQAIKREQDSYIFYHNPLKVLRLYVNDTCFGLYKNIEAGRAIFNRIKEGIKNNESLIDLSI